MTEYYPFYAHIWYGLRISFGGDKAESTFTHRGGFYVKFNLVIVIKQLINDFSINCQKS